MKMLIKRKKPRKIIDIIFGRDHVKNMNIINLSKDEMLEASHILTLLENDRQMDINSCSPRVRNFVVDAIHSDSIEETLERLNYQILTKIGED